MEKSGFTFLFSWAEIVGGLPAEVRLELYDAIIKYARTGTVSELKPMARLAFGFIRKDIDDRADEGERAVVPADNKPADDPELFDMGDSSYIDRAKAEKIARKAAETALKEKIDYLYSLYPSKTLRGGIEHSTGKCSKDKDRIRTLLKEKTPQQIEAAIRKYIDDCRGQYLKNFSTLLNNLPEADAEQSAPAPKREDNGYRDI